jgi:hypothetical protein
VPRNVDQINRDGTTLTMIKVEISSSTDWIMRDMLEHKTATIACARPRAKNPAKEEKQGRCAMPEDLLGIRRRPKSIRPMYHAACSNFVPIPSRPNTTRNFPRTKSSPLSRFGRPFSPQQQAAQGYGL